MNKKLNSEMSAETAADKSGADEVTTSSHSSANTTVGSRFLSEEERVKITRETLRELPMESVGQVALIKLAELAVETNADSVDLKTEATFSGVRYECKMKVTCKKLKKQPVS